MNYAIVYLASAAVFLAIDTIWLSMVAKDMYREKLGHLLADDFNKAAAMGFYSIFIVGILIFATIPAIREGSLSKATIYGGLFGFFTYATYDLTNLATLKNWPLKITILDIVWGTILVALVATVGYVVGRQLNMQF
jgi:uncharacterized membrane protein